MCHNFLSGIIKHLIMSRIIALIRLGWCVIFVSLMFAFTFKLMLLKKKKGNFYCVRFLSQNDKDMKFSLCVIAFYYMKAISKIRDISIWLIISALGAIIN